MAVVVDLEIFVEGQWRLMGQVEIDTAAIQRGIKAPGVFTYALEYLDVFGEHLLSNGIYAASVRYPLNFARYAEKEWPAFLLDLIPTGAARANWIKRLQISDGPEADFMMLSKGAVNPPGHIRVANNQQLFAINSNHAGFTREEVITRGVDFIDYAEKMGAIVSGTSGAQGEAPKFLLVEDQNGRWHGDGAITDDQIKNSWLVKFPRGKKKRDYQILKAEGSYYEIARTLGIRTHGPLVWEDDTLFIPRFDREKDGEKLNRFGLESIVSAHGIPEFGARVNHDEYLDTVKKYSSNPAVEIKEYVFRDFINIVCGNTDNHGRNTAFIKKPNGVIELSPLFDFPPMALDDSGIPRVSKWKVEDAQIPSFREIAEKLKSLALTNDEISTFFADVEDRLANVPALFKKYAIDTEVAMLATRKFDDFMINLRSFRRAK